MATENLAPSQLLDSPRCLGQAHWLEARDGGGLRSGAGDGALTVTAPPLPCLRLHGRYS